MGPPGPGYVEADKIEVGPVRATDDNDWAEDRGRERRPLYTGLTQNFQKRGFADLTSSTRLMGPQCGRVSRVDHNQVRALRIATWCGDQKYVGTLPDEVPHVNHDQVVALLQGILRVDHDQVMTPRAYIKAGGKAKPKEMIKALTGQAQETPEARERKR